MKSWTPIDAAAVPSAQILQKLLVMKERLLVLGVLLALVPALCAAQGDRFRAMDRNGDGSISSEEWYAQDVAPVPFTVVDLNGDGRISESEFREWSSGRGGARVMGVTTADRFRAIDKNKDGMISADEWKNGFLSATPFEAVDANKDGRISRMEFRAWDRRRAPAVAEPVPPPGTAATTMSERMRSLDRGGAGAPARSEVQLRPPAPSSRTVAPAFTATPGVSQIPGVSSPNMRSGSSLPTK